MSNETGQTGVHVPCIELLACPFCGSDDVSEIGLRRMCREDETAGWIRYYVGCHQCGGTIGSINVSGARDEAVKRWNTRSNPLLGGS